MSAWMRVPLCGLPLKPWLVSGILAAPNADEETTWRGALVAGLAGDPSAAVARALKDFPDDFLRVETVADWVAQDGLEKGGNLSTEAVRGVLEELGSAGAGLRRQFDALADAKVPATDRRWAELYLAGCELRRQARLEPYREKR